MMETKGQLVDGIADLVIETEHEVILLITKPSLAIRHRCNGKQKHLAGS